MSNLRTTLEGLAEDDGAYVIDAPEQWSQGRTLYGGMTAALSLEALKRAQPDVGPLRSAQFAFIGPASGRLRLRPELLRKGRSATIVGVDCVGEAGLAARSIFTFGAPRESQIAHDFAWRPDVPPPEACEPFHKGKTRGFVANFELRRASGGNLFEPSAKPEFAVWVRHLDDEGVDPTASFLALADSLPPAAMVVFPKPAMISTMTWSVDFDRPPTARGGWRLLWASSENSADGYSLQNMAVWNADGERLAVARQVVAIFT